jgi:hypothetical protein
MAVFFQAMSDHNRNTHPQISVPFARIKARWWHTPSIENGLWQSDVIQNSGKWHVSSGVFT